MTLPARPVGHAGPVEEPPAVPVHRPGSRWLRTADGERLFAEVWPGPAADRPGSGDDLPGSGGAWIVLAHGFSGSTAVPALRRVADRLAERATVLAYDARGHGRSSGLSTLGDREVLDVDAAVAHARAAGARRVATVGFSMGGAAVVRHAAGIGGVERPDAVVVVSGTGPWSTWGTATRAMRRLHLLVGSRAGRLVTRLVLHTRVHPHGRRPPPVSPADCVMDVTSPLLLVHGDADHYLDLAHPRLMAERSGAPLWVVPGFGHAEEAISPGLVERIGRHVDAALAGTLAP